MTNIARCRLDSLTLLHIDYILETIKLLNNYSHQTRFFLIGYCTHGY